MTYKLAVFDLDGTILNTLEDLADSTNHALNCCALPSRTMEEVRRFVGNGIRNLIERAVPTGTDEELTNKVFEEFRAHYKINCNNKTKPYSGIITMLKAIRELGCKTAVLSNKADAPVKELCKIYFEGLFDYAAGEKEGVLKKPAPDGVYAILDYFDVNISHCVYIGDSEVDVKTAKNANMDFIGVDWGFRDREVLIDCGGKKIAHTAEELTEYICGDK